MSFIKCPNCQKDYPTFTYKCRKCGAIYCSDCSGGNRTPCPRCGNREDPENV